jgi:hypothetical protein
MMAFVVDGRGGISGKNNSSSVGSLSILVASQKLIPPPNLIATNASSVHDNDHSSNTSDQYNNTPDSPANNHNHASILACSTQPTSNTATGRIRNWQSRRRELRHPKIRLNIKHKRLTVIQAITHVPSPSSSKDNKLSIMKRTGGLRPWCSSIWALPPDPRCDIEDVD